jgi:hypothetical protein
MSSQAENQNANEGLTFEKVWAAIQESARKSDLEFEKSRKEREEEALKWKKEREEAALEFEKMRKEAALEMKELRKSMEETARQMKETDRKIGELGNRFGELAEHLVAPSIMQKFNEQGLRFTSRSLDLEINKNGDPNAYAEIDIFLENGEIAVAVEVKAKPKQADVDDHVRRMEILRRKADRHNDTRKFRGAIAGAIMVDAVRNYAIKKGFYVIEQSGDTVLINIPEGFKPREW